MVKRLRIGFCLPFGIILEYTPAYKSYKSLAPIDNWKIHSKIVYGSNVGENRNIVCRDMKEDLKYQKISLYDKVLLVDYDISFTTKDVEQIINHKYDVVSGLYQLKDNSKLHDECNAGIWLKTPGIVNHRYKWSDTGIKSCDWTGAGFLCVNKKVFEQIPNPFFIHRLIEIQKDEYVLRKETMEDIGFSLLCNEFNIEIFVDCDIKLQHHVFFSREKQYIDIINALRNQIYTGIQNMMPFVNI